MSPESDTKRILATRCTLHALASRMSHYIKPRCELCWQKVAKLWRSPTICEADWSDGKIQQQVRQEWKTWRKVSTALCVLDSILKSIQWLNQQHLLNIKCPSWVDNSIWNLWSLSLFHRNMWHLQRGNYRAGRAVVLVFRAGCHWLYPWRQRSKQRPQCCPLNSDEAKLSTFSTDHPKEDNLCLWLFRKRNEVTKFRSSECGIFFILHLKNNVSKKLHHKSTDVLNPVTRLEIKKYLWCLLLAKMKNLNIL